MKNQSGVTLVALVITIIVLIILLSVSMSYGLESLRDSRDNSYRAEANMIAQAVAEQYIKIVELGYENITISTDDSELHDHLQELFIGTIVDGEVPSQMTQRDNVNRNLYSQAYYRLNQADLQKLKIKGNGTNPANINSNYMVNYYTGEVLNESRKQYYIFLRAGTLASDQSKTFNAGNMAQRQNVENQLADFAD